MLCVQECAKVNLSLPLVLPWASK